MRVGHVRTDEQFRNFRRSPVIGDIVHLTCDQAFFFVFFFQGRTRREEKKITPSSRERHKGIIGRGHDLRLSCTIIAEYLKYSIFRGKTPDLTNRGMV